jgi:glucose/arabinose dehydrogenase
VKLVLLPLAAIAAVASIALIRGEDEVEATPAPAAKLVEVGQFDDPLNVASPPGDPRLFVVEKTGRIWIVSEGRKLERPFLDLSKRIGLNGLEEGLLSIAFPPDYASSGLFYVDYTDKRGESVVEEYRTSDDANRADPSSARTVIVIDNLSNSHHGGLLLFGPDGLLYIGQGDGGKTLRGGFPAQSLENLSGKILRIDPRPTGGRTYGIPTDNPFVGRPGRDEIWLYGLRNPWRFDFDPSGALVIGDVGQLSAEEIDIAPESGLNFGWSCFEGNAPFVHGSGGPPSCDDAIPPALELVRGTSPLEQPDAPATVTRGRPRVDARLEAGDPACSITYGVVVRDASLPALEGRHLFGDFCDTSLYSFRVEGTRALDVRPLGVELPLVSSFGVDSSNRVYVTSLVGGLYRLDTP